MLPSVFINSVIVQVARDKQIMLRNRLIKKSLIVFIIVIMLILISYVEASAAQDNSTEINISDFERNMSTMAGLSSEQLDN